MDDVVVVVVVVVVMVIVNNAKLLPAQNKIKKENQHRIHSPPVHFQILHWHKTETITIWQGRVNYLISGAQSFADVQLQAMLRFDPGLQQWETVSNGNDSGSVASIGDRQAELTHLQCTENKKHKCLATFDITVVMLKYEATVTREREKTEKFIAALNRIKQPALFNNYAQLLNSLCVVHFSIWQMKCALVTQDIFLPRIQESARINRELPTLESNVLTMQPLQLIH